jgi:hypothetical protein
MSKAWRVAPYEYRRHRLIRLFVLVVLSLAGVLVLTIGLVALSTDQGSEEKSGKRRQ